MFRRIVRAGPFRVAVPRVLAGPFRRIVSDIVVSTFVLEVLKKEDVGSKEDCVFL